LYIRRGVSRLEHLFVFVAVKSIGIDVIPRIRQIHIQNYKSIAKASAIIEPFTVFVGPNGSGKSNIIDALAFVQECLATSIELAFANRGGIGAVRRQSTRRPTHLGIRLCIELEDGQAVDYAFEITAKPGAKFNVSSERCLIQRFMQTEHAFEVKGGRFLKDIPGIRSKIEPDRLALYAASNTDEFRPVYDFLTSMRFYSLFPDRLRDLQDPDPGDFLKRDGSNAAAVLKRLKEENTSLSADAYDRICRLLSKVVESITKVEYKAVGKKETLRFKQEVGLKEPYIFDASNMSDGTLRVLGVFLAVYQTGHHTVVAIEEPEITVHPAVAELVVDVLRDAALERQVLITTHSPDILDSKEIDDGQIRVVTMKNGRTLISPVSESGRSVIRDKLYTPGELLRMNELDADEKIANEMTKNFNLFGKLDLNEQGGE
jgi:predicted ATPase